MKKFVVGMLACAGVIAASTISFGVIGKVNTDTARVRSEASATSSIVELLSIDDKVEVIEKTGEWYKIKVGNKTGYVSESLLDVEDEVKKEEKTTEETTEAKPATSQEENKTEANAEKSKSEEAKTEESTKPEFKLTEKYKGKLASEVTIKILPSINSMKVAKIEKDAEITVIEIINDWCHIETATYSGWARVKMVEDAVSATTETPVPAPEAVTTEEAKPEEKTETAQNKPGYVNVESVNLRKEKSTSSEKLESLTKNTEVTILGEEDGWYKVKYKSLTGYISKKYLSNKKVEEVTSRASDTARQISESKTTTKEQLVSIEKEKLLILHNLHLVLKHF